MQREVGREDARYLAFEEAGCRFEPGQRDVEVADSKKRIHDSRRAASAPNLLPSECRGSGHPEVVTEAAADGRPTGTITTLQLDYCFVALCMVSFTSRLALSTGYEKIRRRL